MDGTLLDAPKIAWLSKNKSPKMAGFMNLCKKCDFWANYAWMHYNRP